MLHIDLKYIMLLSPRLDKFKRVRDNLFNFRCPYCGDSQKSHSKARGYFYRKKNDYFYKCHNCGSGTNLAKVIQYIDSDLYQEYILERYKADAPKTEKPEFNFEAPKFKKSDPELENLTSINKLNDEHPARQFVKSRQIPEEFYSDLYLSTKFFKWAKISSKQDHPRLVIPFRDSSGEVFAAQGRAFGNETPKYLTVKFQDKPKIFGLDRVNSDQRIYVVEGPIDSLFVDNCIAVAGADFGALIKSEVHLKSVTYILDNEPRSKEIVKKMETLINSGNELVIWPDTILEKDINDMVLAGKDVKEIIDNNTYSGLTATTQLSIWKRI
jgi:transcription elongation factor Elf1